LSNSAEYKVKVRATYKDYLPIDFDLSVRYLPNLDGKTKFVDLGTHIFYKDTEKRPRIPFKFRLSDVLDDGEDDDIDTYKLVLNDGLKDYYQLTDQEDIIELGDSVSKTVPKIGENIATVTEEDGDFMLATRKFFNLPGQPSVIDLPLLAPLEDGELAVVMTWTQGASVAGTSVELQDLDLHVEFQPTDSILCNVDFTMRSCNGVTLTTDKLSTNGKITTIQVAKFDKIGDFDYMVYAERSINRMPNKDDIK